MCVCVCVCVCECAYVCVCVYVRGVEFAYMYNVHASSLLLHVFCAYVHVQCTSVCMGILFKQTLFIN